MVCELINAAVFIRLSIYDEVICKNVSKKSKFFLIFCCNWIIKIMPVPKA